MRRMFAILTLALATAAFADGDAVKGLLLVQSEPAGAEIVCNGLSYGVTPRLITSLDASGVYRMKLVKTGYQPRDFEVRFKGRAPLVKSEKLVSDSGRVTVKCDPAGAEVMINGVNRGKTPLVADEIPRGRALIVVFKEGYESERRELAIAPGDDRKLEVTLEPVKARLRLTAIPEKARFYVDDTAEGAGKTEVKLKPGEHAVRCELEGYGTETRVVVAGPGEELAEEFRLECVMGALDVKTLPAGAHVVLDGRDVGVTEATGGPDSVGMLAIPELLAGEHTVVIKLDGFAEVTRHPVITNQLTGTVSVKLKRVFSPDVEIVTETETYRGVLIKQDSEGFLVETKPGITRVFRRSDIKKIDFIK